MMKQTSGAMGHFEIMRLPWNIFCGYSRSIIRQNEQQKEKKYFKGSSKLANQWQKNKDEWRSMAREKVVS